MLSTSTSHLHTRIGRTAKIVAPSPGGKYLQIDHPARRGDFIMFRVSFLLVFAWLLASSSARADPPGLKTLAIGAAAPDFKLPGVDGKDYTLKSFADARLLLVIFTCNHCPTAQAYEKRIIDLHADYKGKDVALVAISPNNPKAVRLDELGYTDLGDSFEDMKIRAKDQKFAFPYLYDGDKQEAAKAYGALATPQVFLFDMERKLRYVGRIDDSDVKTVSSHDTRNALDALLAGKPVPVETTRVFGCSTKWADKQADALKSLDKWDLEPVKLEALDEAGVAKLGKNEGKKLLLINVWATYCGPCVTELPEFVTMNRMYRRRNFETITISIDDPEKKEDVLKVLKEKKAALTNFIATVPKRDTFADLLDKEWQGPLPHTLLIAPDGKIIYRKTGVSEPLEVRRQIVEFLGRTYASKGK
jgi:peroxiredoxin